MLISLAEALLERLRDERLLALVERLRDESEERLRGRLSLYVIKHPASYALKKRLQGLGNVILRIKIANSI